MTMHQSDQWIEPAFEGTIIYNSKGTIQYANQPARKITGLSLDDFRVKRITTLIHTEDRPDFRLNSKRLSGRKRSSAKLRARIRNRKGGHDWAVMSLKNASGQTMDGFVVLSFIVIPEPNEAGTSVVVKQRIDNKLTEGIFEGTIGSAIHYANRGFLKISGYRSIKELKSLQHLFQSKNDYRKVLRLLTSKGEANEFETKWVTKDKKRVWVRLSIFLSAKKAKGGTYTGVVSDASEGRKARESQKRSAQELTNSRRFLKNVIDTVAAPLYVKNSRYEWILFNEAFRDGRDPGSLVGKTDYHFLDRKTASRIRKIDRAVLGTGKTVTSEEVVPDARGRKRTIISTKSRFVDEWGEKFLIGFVADMTDRTRFEDIIRKNNSTLSAVLESTKDQILALDRKMRYIMFNKAHADSIRGLTGREIQVGDDFISVLPGELIPIARKELKKAFTGKPHTSEIPLPNKTILKTAFNAIRDENQEIVGVAIFAEDISERKKTEIKLKALNEELTTQNWQLALREEDLKMAMDQLSERNFELDQLMYKTSHDLRSPLSSILGLVNLANLDPDKGNLGQYLAKIEGRIKKLDEFISSMVNYARVNRGEITVTEIDLGRTVKAMIQELEYLDNFSKIKTRIVVNHENIPFRNDLFLLKIIIGNVISNAYKYHNPEAKSYLNITIDINPLSALLEFNDNGIGIREKHQGKIFDMFYRATERSQGSGLGMYIVRQAIEKIDGTISLTSKYGAGTTIRISIPNL